LCKWRQSGLKMKRRGVGSRRICSQKSYHAPLLPTKATAEAIRDRSASTVNFDIIEVVVAIQYNYCDDSMIAVEYVGFC
jgi:hypothetical protein